MSASLLYTSGKHAVEVGCATSDPLESISLFYFRRRVDTAPSQILDNIMHWVHDLARVYSKNPFHHGQDFTDKLASGRITANLSVGF